MKGGKKVCPGKMIAGVLRKSIVVMTGGNLKKNVIVMMIGVLNEISVVVNVSLFVAIVKGKIGNVFNVNLKEVICLLEAINTRMYYTKS
ncbi:hypothetical protein [Bacillus mobilis]|uniref:hypothetical protein n=1 Tax=Bacillus mobilis TaxID=2026190 RepID=UPI002E1B8308|nr:hypothetical protein [Bacillus mobilis]MED0932571.1 hypothetical protein [Bacillus mobilis]MED0948944.1 hypothetical protein [Bacillus mobilis]MED0958046.1 hypothetical protein [Bacillus mobilis]MED0998623.1 hypothetical protein [Bacillus mobilis]